MEATGLLPDEAASGNERLNRMFFAAKAPTALGVFYGVASLTGLPFHPDWLTALLS